MLSASLPQQSTAKRNYKAANINDFEEVLCHVSWDVTDFENDDIELNGRIYFSHLWIMYFH